MNLAQKISFIPILSLFVAPATSAATVSPENTHLITYSSSMTVVFSQDDVDVMPSFPGGECAKVNFINATRKYPADAYQDRVQGRVVCSFVVNSDGTISQASIVRGVRDDLNQEAIRIINSMPAWEAGQIDGENVPVYQVMSISFRL